MLKQRALVATIWSGADIFLRQSVQFTVTVLLARLLTPAEFGTIALLALFVGLASVFIDGGLSAALIQRQDTDHTDESTVFWFNLIFGAFVAIALCIAAPFIASFFGLPILTTLTIAMAVNVFVGALGTIQSTLLSKRLDFRTLMKVSAIASLSSGGTALLLAWGGYGVWALAVQSITMTCVTTTLLWYFSDWRPRCTFSRNSARKLFAFGVYHWASNFLEILYSRLYTLLIGRLYGVRELGLYNNAEATKQAPSTFLTSVLARVAFPMFSAAAYEKQKLQRGMQLSIRGMMLLNVPMMLGSVALAEPFIRCLFGEQWLRTVPIFRVLCIAGILFPVHLINLQALMAQGHSRLLFRLELLKKSLGVILLVGGTFFGVLGIAWSQVAFSLLVLGVNTHYTHKFLDYGLGKQLRDFTPILGISLTMATVIYLVSKHWSPAPLTKLTVLVASGAFLFFFLAWVLRLAALNDVIALFRPAPNVSANSGNV